MNKERTKEFLEEVNKIAKGMIKRDIEAERDFDYVLLSAYLQLAYQEIDKE